MPGRSFEYRRPGDSTSREVWCQRISAHLYGLSDVHRFKMGGYEQYGIDLLAVLDDGSAIAIPCKKYNSAKGLSRTEAKSHIAMIQNKSHSSNVRTTANISLIMGRQLLRVGRAQATAR